MLSKLTCSETGCTDLHSLDGRCVAHARPSKRKKRFTMEQRFWAKVDRESGDCWQWLDGLFAGYGRIFFNQDGKLRYVVAHRFAYTLLVGPIPDGLDLDHLCRNRGCVNPAHLEPVTNAENILRGVSVSAVNAVKTHCLRGHEFLEENTYRYSDGSRSCRECRRMRSAAYYAKVRLTN